MTVYSAQTSSYVYVAHWHGLDADTITAAREGRNSACVDCQAEPLDGGLRCHPCFTAICDRNRQTARRNLSAGRRRNLPNRSAA